MSEDGQSGRCGENAIPASSSQAWWPTAALHESCFLWGITACLGRSGAPWIKQEHVPRPHKPWSRNPGGTLRSGRQVAAPARIGVGLRRPALAKRSLTFSRWRSLLSSLAAAGVRFPRSGGGAGARPGPGR